MRGMERDLNSEKGREESLIEGQKQIPKKETQRRTEGLRDGKSQRGKEAGKGNEGERRGFEKRNDGD